MERKYTELREALVLEPVSQVVTYYRSVAPPSYLANLSYSQWVAITSNWYDSHTLLVTTALVMSLARFTTQN